MCERRLRDQATSPAGPAPRRMPIGGTCTPTHLQAQVVLALELSASGQAMRTGPPRSHTSLSSVCSWRPFAKAHPSGRAARYGLGGLTGRRQPASRGPSSCRRPPADGRCILAQVLQAPDASTDGSPEPPVTDGTDLFTHARPAPDSAPGASPACPLRAGTAARTGLSPIHVACHVSLARPSPSVVCCCPCSAASSQPCCSVLMFSRECKRRISNRTSPTALSRIVPVGQMMSMKSFQLAWATWVSKHHP